MLTVRGVSKAFGRVQALQDVSVEFRPGEVHAVLGENGAGKSTLMHLMAGFLRPDAGEVLLDGRPIPGGRPFECRAMGIEMIHQHFMLVPQFTAAENLALARLDGLAGLLDLTSTIRPSLEAAQRLGWEIEMDAMASELPVGAQQRLEILKALGGEARVLIFDEPTAVLSPSEVDGLLAILRSLAAEGRTVVLIAHKLSEVLAAADRTTVLRKGRFVASSATRDVDAATLAHWMVGEQPDLGPTRPKTGLNEGLTIRALRVRGNRGDEAVRGLDLQIRRGEIVGIGGVDGNGQLELAEALAQLRPFEGEILFEGRPLEPDAVGYIPQDRRRDGLALGLDLSENLLLGHVPPEARRGPWLSAPVIASWANDLIRRFEVKADSARTLAGELSGGNQQKVVVARALERRPRLLVAVSPTRGLDLRATAYVHRQIVEAARAGCAVMLVSTDLDELSALADRTSFLSRGELLTGDAALAIGGVGT